MMYLYKRRIKNLLMLIFLMFSVFVNPLLISPLSINRNSIEPSDDILSMRTTSSDGLLDTQVLSNINISDYDIDVVKVVDEIAYIGTDSDGMQIYDVSNPISPFKLGEYFTPDTFGVHEVNRIQIIDTIAFIIDYSEDTAFTVVNISDPTSPTKISSWNSTSGVHLWKAWEYEIHDSLVYMIESYGYFRIYNLSDLYNPINIANYLNVNEGNWQQDFCIYGDYAFIASHWFDRNLLILNISNPYLPKNVSIYKSDETGTAWKIAVKENVAFLALDSRTEIIDIKDKENPTLITKYDDFRIDKIIDSYGYTVINDYTTILYELSNVSNPIQLVNISLPIWPIDFDVVGDYLYCVGGTNLTIAWIQKPIKYGFLADIEQVTDNVLKELKARLEMADETPFIVFERWLDINDESTHNIWAATWNGSVWQETQLSYGGWGSDFDIAISPDGTPHVVFVSGEGGGADDSWPYHTYLTGSGWTVPTFIPGPWGTPPGNNHGNPRYPRIAFDSFGGLHLVLEVDDNMNSGDYGSDVDGLYDIYYIFRSNTGVWDAPLWFSLGGSFDYQGPAIAVDSADGVHVIYTSDLTSNDNIYYRTKPYGGSWTSAITTTTALGQIQKNIFLLIDSTDDLHVIFQDDPGQNLYYQMKVSSSWKTPEFIGNTFAYDVDLNVAETPHICGYDSSNGILQTYSDYFGAWHKENLTNPSIGSFFFPQHEYINTSEVWAFTGRFNQFDDYEIYYKPIVEVTPPINFDYQAFPDENGFILDGVDRNNRYFLVDLKGNTEYFISLVHNVSYNEAGEHVGNAAACLFHPWQIDDPNQDGIADGITNHDQHLLNDVEAEGDGWNRFYSVYIEDSGSYALYVELHEIATIKCFLYIQESPGCMLLNADFHLNKTYIQSIGVDYTFREKHCVYHVPGFKFIWKYIETYLQDPILNPTFLLGETRQQSQFLEYFSVDNSRVNGYLRLDRPGIANYNESNEDDPFCLPLISGNMTEVSLGNLFLTRENDQKTINFTYIYKWYESYEQRINITTRYTFHLNYKAPGHVAVKQDQIINFHEINIQDGGIPLNKCIVYIRFLPYYWKTVGDESINLSPIISNMSGWYSIGDFKFSEVVYNPYYKEYLSNGTVNTKSIHSSVRPRYDPVMDINYTLWYVYFYPHPINQQAPNGNLTKIEYDPQTDYHFDIPSWMAGDDGDEEDNTAPIITIHSPADNSRFNTTAPSYMISIIEDNLDSCYYVLSWDGGESSPFVAGLSGSVDQTLWNTLLIGMYNFTVYANDTSGNLGSNSVTIFKDSLPSSKGIPFGSFYLIVSIVSISLILISVKFGKKRVVKLQIHSLK